MLGPGGGGEGREGSEIFVQRTVDAQDPAVCPPTGWQPPGGVPERWGRPPGVAIHALRAEKRRFQACVDPPAGRVFSRKPLYDKMINLNF